MKIFIVKSIEVPQGLFCHYQGKKEKRCEYLVYHRYPRNPGSGTIKPVWDVRSARCRAFECKLEMVWPPGPFQNPPEEKMAKKCAECQRAERVGWAVRPVIHLDPREQKGTEGTEGPEGAEGPEE